jgi:hypothetical protein
MKINQINNVYCQKNYLPAKSKSNNSSNYQPNLSNKNDISFKGKWGALLGGTLGIVAIVTTGGLATPFVSAIGAIGTAATVATGVAGGSIAEDAIKKAAKD